MARTASVVRTPLLTATRQTNSIEAPSPIRFGIHIVMPWNHLRRVARVGFSCACFFPMALPGQNANPRSGVHPDRLKLEAWARTADSENLVAEAARVRGRLIDGDFKVGDRVIVTYEGLRTQGGDTLIVQSGKRLQLGEPLGDLGLTGVLRFELQDSIANRVGKYFRSGVVHVTPLIRLSVAGAVRAPGYYYSRADTPLSDLITRSAGQDQSTNLRDVVVKREEETIWDGPAVQRAFRDGLTIEALGLVTGDEVAVGARRNLGPVLAQYGLPILSALLITLFIRR